MKYTAERLANNYKLEWYNSPIDALGEFLLDFDRKEPNTLKVAIVADMLLSNYKKMLVDWLHNYLHNETYFEEERQSVKRVINNLK